jgi:ketosteroid isomerase-like protein
MSFDPMASAVDWLDAYRAGDIDTILELYSDEAVLNCGCGGMKTIAGKIGLRTYWFDRLRSYPASALTNLHPSEDGATISYVTRTGLVRAVLIFDANGKIVWQACGPSH